MSPPPTEERPIMTKKETTKLFRLMQNLYPNALKFTEEESMLAWQLVLEPFSYEDIRSAAISFARENKFPPDPGDLCRGLLPPKTQDDRKPKVDAGYAWQRAIEAGRCRDAADEMGSISKYAREHGISWQAAKEALVYGN